MKTVDFTLTYINTSMKISEVIQETATAGATSSGSIAVSVSGTGTKMQRRNPDGTAVNGLDQDSLFGAPPHKHKREKAKKK